MYDEAADAIRREIGMYQDVKLWQSLGRLTVALVLVQLARGDQVAAKRPSKNGVTSVRPLKYVKDI